MRVSFSRFAVVIMLLAVGAGSQPLAAQVPSRYDCYGPSADILSVLQSLNSMNSYQYGGRVETVDGFDFEFGDPISENERNTIQQTLYLLVACANSGNPLQVIPLLSPELLAELISDARYDGFESVIDSLPVLVPDVAEQRGFSQLEIVDAWKVKDRLAYQAIVQTMLPSVEENPTFLVTFIQGSNGLIIDAIWLIE